MYRFYSSLSHLVTSWTDIEKCPSSAEYRASCGKVNGSAEMGRYQEPPGYDVVKELIAKGIVALSVLALVKRTYPRANLCILEFLPIAIYWSA